MISTVPSIPDKTQVFFIAEDEEDDQEYENPSPNRISEQYNELKDTKINVDVQPYLDIPRPRITKTSIGGTIEQEAVTDMTNKHQLPLSNLDSHSTGLPVTAQQNLDSALATKNAFNLNDT